MSRSLLQLLSFIFLVGCVLRAPGNLRADDDFRFNGYFHSGVGINGQGGQMHRFLDSRLGRLGNEDTGYGEFSLSNNWNQVTAPSTAGPRFRGEVMFAINLPQRSAWEYVTPAWPQLYAEISDLWGSPAVFWAGKRYYRRQHAVITDFYYSDMSAPGAGVYDIEVGRMRAAVAVLQTAVSSSSPDIGGIGTPAVNYLDFRLWEIPLPFSGTLEADVITGQSRDVHSYGASLQYNLPSLNGGLQRTVLQYTHGTSDIFRLVDMTDAMIAPASGEQASILSRSWRLRFLEYVATTLAPRWLLDGTFVHEIFYGGTTVASRSSRTDLVVRPSYRLSPNSSFGFEAGTTILGSDSLPVRRVLKLTLAPQINLFRSLKIQAVLRAFATWAWWNESFQGQGPGTVDAGSAYSASTQGSNFGFQAEAAW